MKLRNSNMRQKKKTSGKKKNYSKKAKEERGTAKKARNEILKKELLNRLIESNSEFPSIKDIKKQQKTAKNLHA